MTRTWTEFFLAQVGASAALTGLVFVALLHQPQPHHGGATARRPSGRGGGAPCATGRHRACRPDAVPLGADDGLAGVPSRRRVMAARHPTRAAGTTIDRWPAGVAAG